MMEITIQKEYTILIASLSVWAVSIMLVLFPTIGVTTTVFPPEPIESYKLVFLILTTLVTSIYSLKLGVKHLFPKGTHVTPKQESNQNNIH